MIGAIVEGVKLFGMFKSLAILAAVLLGLGVTYGVWHHKVYREGYTRALSDIAAEDAAALKRATDLRSTWRSCRDRGGRWDQAKGACS